MASGSQHRTIKGNQPTDRPLAVGVGADKLGDIANRRGLGLNLPALGAQGGALALAVGEGRRLPLTLPASACRALRCPSIAESGALVRPHFAASSIAESIWRSRRSRSATV